LTPKLYNFTEIVLGGSLGWEAEGGGGRGLKAGEVTEYSDFGPIDSYISETVQDKFVSL